MFLNNTEMLFAFFSSSFILFQVYKEVFQSSCVLVAQSCLTLATLWTVARQAPLSMEFSRQEY